ncbi:NADP-dependent oxidoreductase [Thermoactinospora rubra]|uniref:NADP-dependent oxidoreductase n=1 Tax=Thermoactinospora rubra TaxID=1088767 RepID=UPI000A10D495|nr:NADP-dependent oxidoreductase [Thermoactinospora rubra]
MKTKQIVLASRPAGQPSLDDFRLVTAEVPELREGQMLVRNTWMSVDPYMRGRMDDKPSYIPPFRIGEPLEGSAVGEVVASRGPVPVGATVTHFAGWREYSVVDDATVIDTSAAPEQAYLGPLGTTGLTAYIALTQIAPVRRGDVVFVSAAAGAVGSVAGQIARRLGASLVIGSAGGPQKAERLTSDFGFDVALDYKAAPIADQLAPYEIDVYLDSVGGDHLEAAIASMRDFGRIALVGAISTYNGAPAPVGNLFEAARKRVGLRGMVIIDHLASFAEYVPQAVQWLREGSLRTAETVVEGLEQAPAALLDVLRGRNVGKMLVRL